jgi:hypothetical protein
VTVPDVRGTHQAWVATIPDDELRAGDDLIINPTPKDWVAIRGGWNGYAVLYGLSFADIYPDCDGDVLP